MVCTKVTKGPCEREYSTKEPLYIVELIQSLRYRLKCYWSCVNQCVIIGEPVTGLGLQSYCTLECNQTGKELELLSLGIIMPLFSTLKSRVAITKIILCFLSYYNVQ